MRYREESKDISLQMIIERLVSLQNEEAQARIIGKGGKKRRDIEMVSGTRIRVKGLTVYISAQFEEQIVLAVQLINQSNIGWLLSYLLELRLKLPILWREI